MKLKPGRPRIQPLIPEPRSIARFGTGTDWTIEVVV